MIHVEVEGLLFETGLGQPVLRLDRLQVPTGAIVAVTGPSGSGKTTLLRAVLGHVPDGLRRASGVVRVDGADVFALDGTQRRELRRREVAIVHQDPGSCLNPSMRVEHLVAETARPGISPREILAQVGLSDPSLLRRRPSQLSGGQQRRVALARALARTPRLLLLDEPSAGLDACARDQVAGLLRRLRGDHGTTVVLSTHDHRLAAVLADRVVDLAPEVPVRTVHCLAPHRADVDRVAGRGPLAREGPPRLVSHRLTVHFDRRGLAGPALADADLVVDAGSAVAVVGPSGAGKSTWARCLVGLQPPSSGAVLLDGRRLGGSTTSRSREDRRRIQLVPQNPMGTLNPALSVSATLSRPLRLHRRATGPSARRRVVELLAQVGLDPGYLDRRPRELSGGQRQRVAVARALAADPDILVCDEITSALDPRTGADLMATLAELRRSRGLGQVLISHDLGLVAGATDRIAVLDNGRVVEEGRTDEVLAAPAHRTTRALADAGLPRSAIPDDHAPTAG